MAENRLTFHNGYRNKNGKAYNSKHNQREGFEKTKNGVRKHFLKAKKYFTNTRLVITLKRITINTRKTGSIAVV
ncbi:MAG: hypothetical protein K2N06_03490 [Oscillospiraceae bacterium]|nr:hypothetical protein [Oscillospiraceae bacterium]